MKTGSVTLLLLFLMVAGVLVFSMQAAGFIDLSAMFAAAGPGGLPPGCDPTTTPNLCV